MNRTPEQIKSSRPVCKAPGCDRLLKSHNLSGYCYRCGPKLHYRPLNRTWRRQKKMAVCHMPGCGKRFELEWWQHATMAWCPECRDRDEYKYYSYKRKLGQEGDE